MNCQNLDSFHKKAEAAITRCTQAKRAPRRQFMPASILDAAPHLSKFPALGPKIQSIESVIATGPLR
jgi:hypothetical protein